MSTSVNTDKKPDQYDNLTQTYCFFWQGHKSLEPNFRGETK